MGLFSPLWMSVAGSGWAFDERVEQIYVPPEGLDYLLSN